MTPQEFFNRYSYNVRTDKIGGGGFGNVYKAYDNVLHREVAIKVSEVKTTPDGMKTFSLKDEFEALKGLPKHPNIANYEEFYSFESPQQGVFDYAVMQYYPDGNLSNLIRSGTTLSQKEEIAKQLLEAVDFLHHHNVVHRDLKPGNILIVRHGSQTIPLITDFGLSKTANSYGAGGEFSNSYGAGTPKYCSPEQLRGRPLKLNTDLWSYGTIVYELFTGEALFEAGSSAANTAEADHEIYNKIVNGIVRDHYMDLPSHWRQVVERCVVVDTQRRVQDAGELRQLVGMPPYQEILDNRPGTYNDYSNDTLYDKGYQSGTSPQYYSSNRASNDLPADATIKTIESLQQQGNYQEAYNRCLDLIKRQIHVDYANRKIEELVPIMQKKNTRKSRIATIVGILLTILGIIIGAIIGFLDA